jgi:hypothetical protein
LLPKKKFACDIDRLEKQALAVDHSNTAWECKQFQVFAFVACRKSYVSLESSNAVLVTTAVHAVTAAPWKCKLKLRLDKLLDISNSSK